MSTDALFPEFDSDQYPQTVVSLRLRGGDRECETPFHRHKKGQLVLATHGHVTCNIDDGIWMVPTHCAVWIPSLVPHSNRISPDAQICMLFIDPQLPNLPQKSCTLSISPLVRELILHLTSLPQDYEPESATAKLVDVLMHELVKMPTEQFDFPIPKEPRLNQIAQYLIAQPDNRETIGQWATKFSMSERTLSRLVKQEIGVTFGRWRGQLHIVIALRELSSGYSVQRVSEDLGYESVSAFITFFKKTLGRPPKQYINGNT